MKENYLEILVEDHRGSSEKTPSFSEFPRTSSEHFPNMNQIRKHVMYSMIFDSSIDPFDIAAAAVTRIDVIHDIIAFVRDWRVDS